MFGYIKPLQGELKVRELERFKACYCGLCHALGRKYGIIARFILSYEFVFLAMLISEHNDSPVIKQKRCIASPFKRKKYCVLNKPLELCAGYSVILTWWKLRDSIQDETFLNSLPHRLASLLLKRPYRKAAREFPDFDNTASEKLGELAEHENLGEDSLDKAADKFSTILKTVALGGESETSRRVLSEILYHVGRWIYIIDAYDDIPKDVKYSRFNPILLKYATEEGKLSDDNLELIRQTLTHSNNLLISAFELLPTGTWSGIIENIICLGMPDTAEHVLAGSFPTKCKKYQ
jgi:hypothetical protein